MHHTENPSPKKTPRGHVIDFFLSPAPCNFQRQGGGAVASEGWGQYGGATLEGCSNIDPGVRTSLTSFLPGYNQWLQPADHPAHHSGGVWPPAAKGPPNQPQSVQTLPALSIYPWFILPCELHMAAQLDLIETGGKWVALADEAKQSEVYFRWVGVSVLIWHRAIRFSLQYGILG